MLVYVISVIIDDLPASNEFILSKTVCNKEHYHSLCLQEPHRSADYTRPKIVGLVLVAESPHNKYGNVILIRTDLKG